MLRVLIPIDGSPRDQAVLLEAMRLAEEQPIAPVLVGLGELPEVPEHAAEERAALEALLDRVQATLGYEAERTVEMTGDPASGMLEAAEDFAVDRILLPTAAQDGHSSPLAPAIAQDVLTGAAAEVVLCGPPIHTPAIARALAGARRRAAFVRRPRSAEPETHDFSSVPSPAPAATVATIEHVEACPLWVTLHRNEPHPSRRVVYVDEEPALFLHFKGTGLMVGLPGESPSLLDGSGERTFELFDTDVLGLGLQPADFEDGVVLCGGHDGDLLGWHCEPVVVLGTDGDGTQVPLLEPAAVEQWLAR